MSLRPCLLMLLALAACTGDAPDDSGTPSNDTADLDTNAATPSATLDVADQDAVEVDAVIIDRVDATEAAFVAIYHDDGNGTPGALLGVTDVFAGGMDTITVDLERWAGDGESLVARVHADRGVFGRFEFPGPDVVLNTPDGAPASATFTITNGAPGVVVVDDQQLYDTAASRNNLIIRQIFLAEDDTVWIYKTAPNSNEPRDYDPLARVDPGPGFHQDVEVVLGNENIQFDEQLWARVEYRSGPNRSSPLWYDAANRTVQTSFIVQPAN